MEEQLYAKTVISQIASTELEKQLKGFGDTANIRIMPTFTKKDYTAGMTLVPSSTAPTKVQLLIDHGFSYCEAIDDVIAQQSDVRLVDDYTKGLTSSMAVEVDAHVLAGIQTGAGADNSGATAGVKTGGYDMGATGAPISLNSENALQKLTELIAVLKEQNVDKSGMWVLVPSWFTQKLILSDLKMANEMGDSTSTVRTGLVGKISGVDVFESNNMTAVTDGTTSETCWYALAGHSSAVAFAQTIDKFRVVEPTNTFGSQIQLLNVFGFKVVQSKYLASLYCTMAA
jgi:hypothetical protein